MYLRTLNGPIIDAGEGSQYGVNAYAESDGATKYRVWVRVPGNANTYPLNQGYSTDAEATAALDELLGDDIRQITPPALPEEIADEVTE